MSVSLKSFSIIFIGLVFSSCSILFTNKQRVYFQKDELKEDVGELNLINTKPGGKARKIDEKSFSISNKQKGYIVNSNKKGNLTRSMVINRRKINPLYILDIIVPIAAAATFSTSQENTVVRSLSFYTMIFGWGGVIFGPSKLYQKNYTLPNWEKKIHKKENENFIDALELKYSVESSNHYINDYQSYNDFTNGIKKTKEVNSTSIITKDFEKDIYNNSLLEEFGYLDPRTSLTNNNIKGLSLRWNIVQVEENNIGLAKIVKAKSEVTLINSFDNSELYKKDITSFSTWRKTLIYESDYLKRHTNDIIKSGFNQLLTDNSFKGALNSYEKEREISEIIIKLDSNYSKDLKNAVKSVITIITNKGHGSGCLISKDGYIITNSHVIANHNGKIQALLSNSLSIECKLIRVNPERDLALLKIDTTVNHYFNLKKITMVSVADEAYTIGAYNIDDYNIGVAKGIVSGNRQINGLNFIQTDATINSGNSGGAFINKEGQLLGIITAKMVGNGIEGLGFVIPKKEIEESLNIKYE